MKILIVDDNADDRNILRLYLSHVAAVVLEAANGEDGLVIARSDRPDLIISDALMPKIDGFEFLREVRRTTELCTTPFIFYSAVYTGTKEKELARLLGADAFLVKPLEAEEFLAQLKILLENLDTTKERPASELLEEDEKYLRKYSQIVAARLELKVRELELLHNTLEARVNEMVADLRRKDQALIQQSRLASMGEMIGHIAHQWRNPLNNVALIIQNIQLEYDAGTLTGEAIHSDTHKAMDVLLQMSHTIDDFSNFFRDDKEKQGFSIHKAINRTLELVSATLNNNRFQVKIESDETVTAIGYQNEYAQVLLNIISNACEACIERRVAEPCIHFRITRENERSVLYIRDNCGGIPDDVLPKIFDPYFTTRGPDRGSGIGLYMSKVIIEQNMGGHLTACNVDTGAEFRIEV